MSVPIYNFKRLHHKQFRDQALERFAEIMEENSFIEGRWNQSFEKKFAKQQEAAHCLLVGNGTDALEIALKACNIGVGDLVGIPCITFYATAESVLNVGARPILIDVDSQTGLICPKSLERVLKEHQNLKAVIPVHIYGLPAPIREIESICKPKNIKIIEDAAQAHGLMLESGPVGSTHNITTFSFYPTKNLGAFGDAGAILTQDEETAKKILSLRNHGRSQNGIQFFGRNSRCDSFQAAVLDLKLDYFQEYQQDRKRVAQKYLEGLKGLPLELCGKDYLESSSWHLFPILVKNHVERMALKKFLEQSEIGSALFYNNSLAQEIPLQDCSGERKISLEFASRVICLPIYPYLENKEVEEIIKKIHIFYQQ